MFLFIVGNVTREMEAKCDKWLMGEQDDNRPCETSKKEIDIPEKSPYYKYYKYKVQFYKESPEPDQEWTWFEWKTIQCLKNVVGYR